jgi:hypothetical protein
LVAHDIRDYQLSGPDWLDTLRFDISAKVPEGVTKEHSRRCSKISWQAAFRRLFTANRSNFRSIRLWPPGMKPAAAAKPAEEPLAVIQAKDGHDGFPLPTMNASGLTIETRNGRGRISAKEVSLSQFADLLSSLVATPSSTTMASREITPSSSTSLRRAPRRRKALRPVFSALARNNSA